MQHAQTQTQPPSLPTSKNILVTGGLGFIGSQIVRDLVRKYPSYNIFNFDKNTYCSSLSNVSEIASYENYSTIIGDLRHFDLVRYVLDVNNIDTIIHAAAFTHVDNSFGNSIEFTHNNVEGTHVLLEACRQYGKIKRFIHVSTDEVYGEGDCESSEESKETSKLCPTNPYAATKAAAEMIVQSYKISFGLPVIITRGNNVYGPYQFPEKLIPKFFFQLETSGKCTLHGDGSNLRNFLHVQDVSRAFDVILHHGQIGEIYNIGGSNEKSVLAVTKHLLKSLGRLNIMEYEDEILFSNIESTSGLKGESEEQLSILQKYVDFVEDRHFNDLRYHIDSSKLKALGWREEISWEDGLSQTLQWYSDNFEYVLRRLEGTTALNAHPQLQKK